MLTIFCRGAVDCRSFRLCALHRCCSCLGCLFFRDLLAKLVLRQGNELVNMPPRDAEWALGCLRLLDHVLWMYFRKFLKVRKFGPWLEFRTDMA